MANDAAALRKQLLDRGYDVARDGGQGKSSWIVTDPRKGGIMVARFPVAPKPGSWRSNVLAGIRRYERTGQPARSPRVPARKANS
jgi:hypothetical protein